LEKLVFFPYVKKLKAGRASACGPVGTGGAFLAGVRPQLAYLEQGILSKRN
jgi:hypothetical protein